MLLLELGCFLLCRKCYVNKGELTGLEDEFKDEEKEIEEKDRSQEKSKELKKSMSKKLQEEKKTIYQR